MPNASEVVRNGVRQGVESRDPALVIASLTAGITNALDQLDLAYELVKSLEARVETLDLDIAALFAQLPKPE